MRAAVRDDLRLEGRQWKTLCSILGNQFFKKDIEADLHSGSDMVLATLNKGRINVGCRLRTNDYIKWAQYEITIRFSRPSGASTEWHKLNDGLFDYMLYGFVSHDESKIVQWVIIDCKILLTLDIAYKGPFSNNPPDSKLIAYELRTIKDAILNYYPKFIFEEYFDRSNCEVAR